MSTGTLERIGRYALEEEIGHGAMGVVYRAQDPLIQRTVAVKILHLPRALPAERLRIVRERFAREAQTAGILDHPNIVKIFDVGEDETTGEPYIVMEYIPGPSLERLLAENRFDRDRIGEVVAQIASALDCAHARGIIHRDIKPANILFTAEGVPKLNDFGIARVASSDLTQEIRDLGTPVYMSPEQVNGQPITARADLFALGVLCYRLLAGRVPFEGRDAVSIAYQIVHSTPSPPSWVEPSVPGPVDAVMERILAKDPAARYASGREFQEALVQALRADPCTPEEAAASAPAPRARRPAILWGVPALALLGLAVAAIWVFADHSEPAAQRPPAPASAGTSHPEGGTASTPAPAPSVASATTDRGRAPLAAPARSIQAPVPKPRPRATERAPARPASRSAPRSVANAPRAAAAREKTVKAREIAAPRIGSGATASIPPPPAAAAAGPASLTISLGHRVSRGTLTVFVDGRAVLAEEFTRGKMTPYQITTWDAMSVASGRHQVSARLEAEGDDKVYRSEPLDADFGAGKDVSLRVSIKEDTLALRLRQKTAPTSERDR